jgi:ribosomal protein S6--L-glutamate ligase
MKLSDCEKWLLQEGEKIFDTIAYVPIPDVRIEAGEEPKVMYKNKDLSKLDFIIPRIPRAYVWIGYIILEALKGKVYFPIEPKASLIVHNKFMALLDLKLAGLPVPPTYLATSRQTMENLLDEMTYPVVMKLLYGSLGVGVMFADSKSSAISVMDTLERFEQPIFLEEYVKHPGEDIRAFVLGGEVIAAMKRKAISGERRTNISVGSVGEATKLEPELEELAIRTAKTLGTEILGVDIIQGPKGPVVIEANVNVHFEGLTKATGMNIARAIAYYVKGQVESTSGILSRLKR